MYFTIFIKSTFYYFANLRNTLFHNKAVNKSGLIIISICFLFFSGCNLINPSEQIPSYLSINNISFKTNISFDTDSHNITDAWVYVDDQLIGAFELPAKFPVLFTGRHEVKVYAGIKLNGISSTRTDYPFYEVFDTTLNLTENKVLKINPHTTYDSKAYFAWTENFENNNLSLTKLKGFSDTTIVQMLNAEGEDYFQYGNKYVGAIYLTSAKPTLEIITDTSYTLPTGQLPSFLEFDYKISNQVLISIETLTAGGNEHDFVLGLNTNKVWNHIYVNLTPYANRYSYVYGFKLIFDSALPTGTSQAKLLFDNFKLVYNH